VNAYADDTENRFDCVLAINALDVNEASIMLTQMKKILSPKGYMSLAQLIKT
jgi:hypothetical protein